MNKGTEIMYYQLFTSDNHTILWDDTNTISGIVKNNGGSGSDTRTIYGKILVAVVALVLFSYANPILGVLGFIVAFDLIRRSSVSTGTFALDNYVPTETKKEAELTEMNQFPYTLEQEVVKKMAPIPSTTSSMNPVTFTPLLNNLHDASPVS